MVIPGNLSAWAIQSKLPESTIAPPTQEPWPSMYLVVAWVTMSTPYSNGRQLIGVGNVLSTMIGTPWSCAAETNLSKSSTISAGFEIDSANTALVFGWNAASSSSGVQSGLTNVHSMPILRIVTLIRLNVPP